MKKPSNLSKIFLLGAAMTLGTFSFSPQAVAEGGEDEPIPVSDDVFCALAEPGPDYPEFCDAYNNPPPGRTEYDWCSIWENDVYDAADRYYNTHGFYPGWFYYWQSNGFSFVGYSGAERPISWFGSDLINTEQDNCG